MAERISYQSAEETSDDSDVENKDYSKKKKKSSKRFGASIIGRPLAKDSEAYDKSETNKGKTIDRMLADMLLEKADKPVGKESSHDDAATEKIPDSEYVEDGSTSERYRTSSETDGIEYELSRELSANELSGGEVIINLRDRVIPDDANTTEVLPDGLIDTSELSIKNSDVDYSAEASGALSDDSSETAPSVPPEMATGSGGGSWSNGSGGGNSRRTARGASGGGNGNLPPNPPTSASPFPSFPRRRPNSANTIYNGTVPQANIFNMTPLAATGFDQLLKAQLMAEAAKNRLKGRSEGMFAGLLLGGGIEHFKHVNRERKQEKKNAAESKRQAKHIENIESRQLQIQQEQIEAARRTERERYAHRDALKAETAAVAKAQIAETTSSARAMNAEKDSELQEKQKAELIERLNAQARAQEEMAEKIIPDEHRVETSAWHAYEVDKQGNAVQESSIEYGHEYYQERAAETGPKDQQIGSKAGSAAIAGTTMNSSGDGGIGPVMARSSQPTHSNQDLGLPPLFGVKPDASQSDSSAASTQPLTPLSPANPRDDTTASTAGLVPWILAIVVIAVLIAILS